MQLPTQSDSNNRRSWLWSLFPVAALVCIFFFLGSALLAQDQKEILVRYSKFSFRNAAGISQYRKCKNQCRPEGSEALPEGIVCKNSNLEMQPLWGRQKKKRKPSNLFTVSVGIKQREMVDKMVRKFLSSNFTVMLFHYDGLVDKWKDIEWNNHVVHVSAINQTKWWFAKRFLHPAIVAEYDYVFLWDEDLGVDDFHPQRYLEIVQEEGLEISQPALDPKKSDLHHQITTQSQKTKVHRRIYKPGTGAERCDENSSAPPCTGWIEVMAPVFSRAAWRCVWYMIQNDLIHAWGLDMQIGYCAQGDRTKNVGIVDSEYIVHYGIPTLGENAKKTRDKNSTKDGNGTETTSIQKALPNTHTLDNRVEVSFRTFLSTFPYCFELFYFSRHC